MSMTIKVETTGQFRSGIAAKSGKPYFMCEAFAHLPGVPYPQKFSYYAAAQTEMLPPGLYECDVMANIKDDRINFEVDPRQGLRISSTPVSATAQNRQQPAASMTIKVETTGQFRSGIAAKSGKPYFMCEAFAHLPGVPYPQKFSYYAAAQTEMLPPGLYECDVMANIKDDRINFEVDPRQGRRISSTPVSATAQNRQQPAAGSAA